MSIGHAASRSLILVGVLAALVGCGTIPANPHNVSVETSEPSQLCGQSDEAAPVYLVVRNNGEGKLQLRLDQDKGPPFPLNWLYYKVLSDSLPGDHVDRKHGYPGGHGAMPIFTLSIGPGDSTTLVGWIYAISESDYSKQFQIEFEDVRNNKYTSAPVFPCRMKSTR